MIPGPISPSISPISPDDALLIGTKVYKTAAEARADGVKLEPNDPKRETVNFVPSAQRWFTRDGSKIISHTGGINMANDDQTFPAWTGGGFTVATLQQPPAFPAQLVDYTTLCTEDEAKAALAMIQSSGLFASMIGDMSLPENAGGVKYNWGSETRRPWGLSVTGTSGSPVWAARAYALAMDKSNGKAGGVGVTGTYSLDPMEPTCGLRFTPTSPNQSVAGPEVRALVPPEELKQVGEGLMAPIMLVNDTGSQAGPSAGGGLTSDQDARLSRVEAMLVALLEADRVPLPK